MEAKLNKEIMELSDTNQKLENRVDELERKCRTQQEQVLDMKERLSLAQSDNKMQSAQSEGVSVFWSQTFSSLF